MEPIPLPRAGFTSAEMRAVDKAMDVAGVGLLQMAELAGAALARAVVELAEERRARRAVLVLAGPGGNSAGGLAAARQLLARGVEVRAVLVAERPPRPEVAALAAQLRAFGVAVLADPPASWDGLVLDALLGYGARGPPRGAVAAWVRAARSWHAPVVANDLPSGLEPDTGAVHDPILPADATVTLCYPKRGLLAPGARRVVGRLRCASLGVPAAVYHRFGVDPAALFGHDSLVDVATGG